MEKHINLIAILWIVMGAIGLMVGFLAFLILIGVSLIPDMGDIAPNILRLVAIVLSAFLLLLGLPKIIAGIGLLKRREWARILVLILSVLSLLNIPFGTALGIYSLIMLTKPEMIRLFQSKT